MEGGRRYGYARVSSRDQNLDRQIDALRAEGLEDRVIYTDKASGKDFERPAWRKLVRRLREGDVLFVGSIDRLGRNYTEIIDEWRRITKEKGAHIVVLDMPLLDTRKGVGGITGALITDIVLQLLSYVAHVERDHIRKRQAEGIASAKARGVRFGRPRIERPGIYGRTKRAYEEGAITRREAASRLKVSVATFDTWVRADRKETEQVG